MTAPELEQVSDYFMMWKNAEKQFLGMLIQRIIRDVPEFNYELLVTHLQLAQEYTPTSADDPQEAGHLFLYNKFLGEITEVVESAIKISTSKEDD
ncbi:hypothetical protein [Mesorhizobium sp. CN2-181]|uniref:hypothetical protein n=1 Tax=Mesorhizobium yinganensis TaxID=3157707 RepID=UPI0032B85E66